MDVNPSDRSALPTTNQVEFLTECLCEDLFELVDGLFPLEIVNHVTRAVFMLKTFAPLTEPGTSTYKT
jgi:hypothetical protein